MFSMSSATVDALLECARGSHSISACQRMQSAMPLPFAAAPDLTCPLATSGPRAGVSARAAAVAQRPAPAAQQVMLAAAGLLALNAALTLCLLWQRRQHTAGGSAAVSPVAAVAAEVCCSGMPQGAHPGKQLSGDLEPCASRYAPAAVMQVFAAATLCVVTHANFALLRRQEQCVDGAQRLLAICK